MTAPGRCEFTWNPGTWPYTARCKKPATQERTIQDKVPDDSWTMKVCNEHAELIDQQAEVPW